MGIQLLEHAANYPEGRKARRVSSKQPVPIHSMVIKNFLDAWEFENPTSGFQPSTNGQRLKTWAFSGGSCVMIMGTKYSANSFPAYTEICPPDTFMAKLMSR